MESVQSTIDQLKAVLVDFETKQHKVGRTHMSLLSDYVQMKQDMDRILGLKPEHLQLQMFGVHELIDTKPVVEPQKHKVFKAIPLPLLAILLVPVLALIYSYIQA